MGKRKRNKVKKNLVSVIIPVYRRYDLLAQCLYALPDAFGDVKYDVIIVDNGSPKEEADEFYAQYSNLNVLRYSKGLGFPKACNFGADKSNSPLLFFLNDDVILGKDSANLLVRAMDDPSVGVCGMKLLFPTEDNTKQGLMGPASSIQHIGISTNINAEFKHTFIGWSKDNPRVNRMRDVYAVTGAALMTRRSLFLNAGKFFTGYGLGTWEDVDYCLTGRELGYNVIVEPKAEGVHYVGGTSRQYDRAHPLNENRQIFMQRWTNKLQWNDWKVL